MRYVLIFNDLNYNLDVVSIIIITSILQSLRFNSIFPGNLGLRETLAGAVSKIFGISFAQGMVAALVDRIVDMFWIFLLGIWFSFRIIIKDELKRDTL